MREGVFGKISSYTINYLKGIRIPYDNATIKYNVCSNYVRIEYIGFATGPSSASFKGNKNYVKVLFEFSIKENILRSKITDFADKGGGGVELKSSTRVHV